MSTSFKIRLLLLILSLSLAATALTLNLTFHPERTLEYSARTIQRNLWKKERFAQTFSSDKRNLTILKTLREKEKSATSLIKELRDKRNIYLFTFENNKLQFWGGNRILLETDSALKEGSNLLKNQNGIFEAIKVSDGRFSAVFVLPIRFQYPVQNKYLQNRFSRDLIQDNSNIDVATISDTLTYAVRSFKGKYLFPIKLRSSVSNSFYPRVELWAWALSALVASAFITYVSIWVARKWKVRYAILLMLLYFLVLRAITLNAPYLYRHFNLSIFDPHYYSGGPFIRTVGDILLNLLVLTWLLCFIYGYRDRIGYALKKASKTVRYISWLVVTGLIFATALIMNKTFFDLVTNSEINFDLTNILNLGGLSWLAILLLCFSALDLILIQEVAIVFALKLPADRRRSLALLAPAALAIIALGIWFRSIPAAAIIFSFVVSVHIWLVLRQKNRFNLAVFIFTILAFATIASIKLSQFLLFKEREQRMTVAKRIESGNDPNAVFLFMNIEQKIRKDKFIINYLKQDLKKKYLLDQRINNFYLEGYLSQYDYKIFAYGPDGSILNSDSTSLSHFRDLVIAKSQKVSRYFYRINNSFGYQNYFALLPYREHDQSVGTIVIELKSKTFKKPSFPEVLTNRAMISSEALNKYAVAFYKRNKLLYQYGQYIYDLKNEDFRGKPGKFVFSEKGGFSHLIYQKNSDELIVVSKPKVDLIMQLGSVSFLFLVFALFTIAVTIVYWLAVNFRNHDFRIHLFNWDYLTSHNQILYRTRIQASMVAAIISTLVIIGIITFISIGRQFRKQQQDTLLTRLDEIADGFEKKMFENGKLVYDDPSLSDFANANASDLNLYAVDGRLLFSTQPKIYEFGLLGTRMDPLAYVYLNKYQRSEYLNDEKIGNLSYYSAYRPVRNDNNETLAYLSLPYYQYYIDIESQTGSFLNTLINVYALVLVTVGLFAVFVANKITYPLTLVQKSLAQIKIGSKNELIVWKRNDEIGSLIKEYNNMILALEESAQKLARSERESAWREMAKQVAHEIKNPLTPLKLGVQLLEKSWKEKDPNFDKKFEKFTKSFIEQIESLSLIASEFSNFAKMPDTTFVEVNLPEVIERSIEVYNKVSELSVSFKNLAGPDLMIKGNNDQLLRIFNNLIKNAIEAIPDYKEGLVEITLSQGKGMALIQIRDNGKGIPEGLQERIFHPNFTTKSSGTGLGLAFVKQAVENMMGRITFETRRDEGTTFFIDIPLSS